MAAALIWFIAYGDIKIATRALLSMEGLTVTLIVIVVVVIFARVFAGTAPSGQSFTLSPFTPPSGVGWVLSPLPRSSGFSRSEVSRGQPL